MDTFFFNGNQTFPLSGNKTDSREDTNIMDLADIAVAEQTARNSPSVPEVRANLAFFLLTPGEHPKGES